MKIQVQNGKQDTGLVKLGEVIMPTIDDLLKSLTNTETQAICSTETLSTSNEENIMTRFHDLLNELKNAFESVAEQKTYKGIKRSELKDSDFLFPETRSFPIVSPADVPDAISNFGRMKGTMSYDDFLKKLYNMAKRKGPEFVAALPKATKDKLGIKTAKAECEPDDSPEECEKEKLEDKLELETIKKKLKQIKASMPFNLGDSVINTNPNCVHYGSKGKVCGIEKLPDEMGEIVAYLTTNEGQNWKMGDILKKTANQLSLEDEIEEENYEEMDGYKQSYYEMSVGSLRAIMSHAKDILDYLDNPMVKENLTAPHLQGMIAVAEDHMRSIHDFVMFVETDDDQYEEEDEEDEEEIESKVNPVNITKKRKKIKISDLPHYEYQLKQYPGVTTTMGQNNRPGLWENIRKKKEREGKKYRPAKPGDKDRPDSKQWKNLTK